MKVKKINTIAELIRRIFSYLDGHLFKKLFTTFVKPYEQVIWTPHLKKYMTLLENVQYGAATLVDGFHHISYVEKLKSWIYHRWFRGELKAIWKRFSNISISTITVRCLKILDLETVLVENTTTNWYGKHPKMVWENCR